MKFILILLLAIGIYSCGDNSAKTTEQSTVDTINKPPDGSMHKSDTLNIAWINEFRNFRNAIYQDDITKIKSYFSFPVLDSSNEIWSVVLGDSSDTFTGVSTERLIPFTEKDLGKYYRKLFNKEFKIGILKIKSDELFQKSYASIESINIDSSSSFFMTVSVNKVDNTLNIALSYNTAIKDENGDFEDGGESSIGYAFIIQKDGHLLFKQIRIAG
jgi:hypothetical protein